MGTRVFEVEAVISRCKYETVVKFPGIRRAMSLDPEREVEVITLTA